MQSQHNTRSDSIPVFISSEESSIVIWWGEAPEFVLYLLKMSRILQQSSSPSASSGECLMKTRLLKKVQTAILPKSMASLIIRRVNDYHIFLSDSMDLLSLCLHLAVPSYKFLAFHITLRPTLEESGQALLLQTFV